LPGDDRLYYRRAYDVRTDEPTARRYHGGDGGF